MSPVEREHFKAKMTRDVSLVGTVTVRSSCPVVQSFGRDEAIRWWSPAETPESVKLPVSALVMLWGLAPSIAPPQTKGDSSPGLVEKLTMTVPGSGARSQAIDAARHKQSRRRATRFAFPMSNTGIRNEGHER